MTRFKLFYDWQGSTGLSVVIYASDPEDAARKLRKQAPGAIIHKTKVDKSGNVSPRQARKEFRDSLKPECDCCTDIRRAEKELAWMQDGMIVEPGPINDTAKWEHVGDKSVRPNHR